jgi:hypothetical protein
MQAALEAGPSRQSNPTRNWPGIIGTQGIVPYSHIGLLPVRMLVAL